MDPVGASGGSLVGALLVSGRSLVVSGQQVLGAGLLCGVSSNAMQQGFSSRWRFHQHGGRLAASLPRLLVVGCSPYSLALLTWLVDVFSCTSQRAGQVHVAWVLHTCRVARVSPASLWTAMSPRGQGGVQPPTPKLQLLFWYGLTNHTSMHPVATSSFVLLAPNLLGEAPGSDGGDGGGGGAVHRQLPVQPLGVSTGRPSADCWPVFVC